MGYVSFCKRFQLKPVACKSSSIKFCRKMWTLSQVAKRCMLASLWWLQSEHRGLSKLCLKPVGLCTKYIIQDFILKPSGGGGGGGRARWHSGNTLAPHLWGQRFKPQTLCGKVGSCLPMVCSLQYWTLTNCMYWFPLPAKLLVMIRPVQCWKRRKTPI